MTDNTADAAATRRSWWPWLLLAAALVAAVLGGWLVRDDGSLHRVRAAGLLRVGYAVEAPYALVQPDGSVSGESPEVAAEVAREMGLRVQWIRTDFERLMTELELDRFDVIAAGLFVNPQRAQRVRFSVPTLRVRPGWLVAAGNPKALADYRGVDARTAVRVGVLAGSVEQQALQSQGAGLLVLRDVQSALVAMRQGAIDAIALSLPTVRQMAAASEGRFVAVAADGGDAATGSHTALAFRREDKSLQQAVDVVLARYLGSTRHLQMLQRFNLTADDLPVAAAAAVGVRDAGSR